MGSRQQVPSYQQVPPYQVNRAVTDTAFLPIPLRTAGPIGPRTARGYWHAHSPRWTAGRLSGMFLSGRPSEKLGVAVGDY
jgi:hypothetical protein